MSSLKKPNKKRSSNKLKSVRKNGIISVRSSRVSQPTKPGVQPEKRDSKAQYQTTPPQPGNAIKAPTQGSSGLRIKIFRALALLAVVGITLYVYNIRDRVEEFAAFGYPGILLIAMLANATILLPAPGAAIVYAMGASALFNPLWVGIAAGSGGAIGELTGYLAGFSGQAVIERLDIYERTKPWIDRYGGWAILVLSAIPNPFFDAAGIAAGIAKMPLRTFLFSVWIGQLIKMTSFAYAGRYSLEWLAQFLN